MQMAAKPLNTEAIALTEKKVDMALDDIIKLSKNARTKSKGGHRAPNKNKKFVNNQPQDKAMKVRRFMDSRSSLRQGALAKRRSSFEENQFPLTTEAAQKAAVAPLHNRAFGHNRVPNWNKQRAGPQVVQRRPVNGGFPSKQQRQKSQLQNQNRNQYQPQKQHQSQPQRQRQVEHQRPQTLDSLFANMADERIRAAAHQNNGAPRNRGGQQRPPWRRG